MASKHPAPVLQFDKVLEAYRRASKQWSATLNRFAEGAPTGCVAHHDAWNAHNATLCPECSTDAGAQADHGRVNWGRNGLNVLQRPGVTQFPRPGLEQAHAACQQAGCVGHAVVVWLCKCSRHGLRGLRGQRVARMAPWRLGSAAPPHQGICAGALPALAPTQSTPPGGQRRPAAVGRWNLNLERARGGLRGGASSEWRPVTEQSRVGQQRCALGSTGRRRPPSGCRHAVPTAAAAHGVHSGQCEEQRTASTAAPEPAWLAWRG